MKYLLLILVSTLCFGKEGEFYSMDVKEMKNDSIKSATLMIDYDAKEMIIYVDGIRDQAVHMEGMKFAIKPDKTENSYIGTMTFVPADSFRAELDLDKNLLTIVEKSEETAKEVKIPLTKTTMEQFRKSIQNPFFFSLEAFKAHIKKGADIDAIVFVRPSAGLEDIWDIKLLDGSKISIFAPDGKVESCYIKRKPGAASDSEMEWIIK